MTNVDDIRDNWLNPIDSLEDKYPDIVDFVNKEIEDNFNEIFLEILYDYPIKATENIIMKFATNKEISATEANSMSNELQEIYKRELNKYKNKNFKELFKNKLDNL